MAEITGKYEVEESTENARAMMGMEPSVVIEPPRRTIQRRGKRMEQVEEAAFVKFSTAFKSELADLDVYALKVFIYIGLSINFETGTAYPGIRKIAKETKMDKDTVAKAIIELEEKGFLHIWRKEGSSNTYKPECYFAIGETVPSGRTVAGEPSDEPAELSLENAKLSLDGRVNRAQQDKQDKQDEIVKDDAKIFNILERMYGALRHDTPRFVDTWLEKHSLERIIQAIDIAKSKGNKPIQYIDSILIGWEANGYPKTREEQVRDRKTNGKALAPSVADNWLARKERELANGNA